jgi:TrkA domain protein
VPGSPFDGRTLGDTRARTLTGCSIVAIVRGSDVVPSPSPADQLRAGDVLVAIGASSGLEQLDRRLSGQV